MASLFFLAIASCLLLGARTAMGQWAASEYLTTMDAKSLIALQSSAGTWRSVGDGLKLDINTSTTYQTMYGFGYCLTGGSAQLIAQLSKAERHSLLVKLFSVPPFPPLPSAGGMYASVIRLSIGSSDLNPYTFSYDDMPSGQTDTDMTQFTLQADEQYLIPVLQEILQINPSIIIFGSPWSPPVWMKDNGNTVGGSLLSQYYDAYALYFVKYILAMKEQGIPVHAITVQNEPLNPYNNPSLLMYADDQAAFIRDSLGPAFRQNNISTKIVIYDHNADRPDYPISVLSDPDARQYIDGSAFHLYAGSIDALSSVHDAYPDKSLYFTEQWISTPGNFAGDFTWHIDNIIIGASRNWCRAVLEWNVANDPNADIHTPGGCTQCLGAVTISGSQVTEYNPGYFVVGQAATFVRPNDVRVESNVTSSLNQVAFMSLSGTVTVIVQNQDSKADTQFAIRLNGGDTELWTSLPPSGVATYVFSPTV